MKRRAVFLDRDGTINDEVGYCGDPEMIRLLPGAAAAVRRINDLGLLAIIVTNQSAIARGMVTEDQVRRVNAEVALQVARESGGRFDAIYYSPFHPTEGDDPRFTRESDWRKPGGGMLRQAARDFDIDLAHSFMVGDGDIDHQAAKDAHRDIVTFQVPSKYNHGAGEHQAPSLGHAAELISREVGTNATPPANHRRPHRK